MSFANYLDIRAAAEYTGRSTHTLRSYVRTGQLPAHRLGPQQLRFDPADLDALMRPVTAKSDPIAEHIRALVEAEAKLDDEQIAALQGILRAARTESSAA